jgi:hypothetical protein
MMELYLVEIIAMDGSHVGLEKFMELDTATEFIDNYADSSSYCNLYEAKQLDY